MANINMRPQINNIIKEEERERQKSEDGLQKRIEGYGANPSSQFSISGTPEERAKALEGLEFAGVGYGQGIFDIGEDIQRVKDLQRQRTEGSDPVSQAIRNQKSGEIARAQREAAAGGVKGGAAMGAASDIARKYDSDVAASLYGQQAQNIGAERSLASNMLAGTTSLMQGSRGEGTAANLPQAPQATGAFGTVICTELYEQGYYTKELYMKDVAYGALLRKTKPDIYEGYRMWSDYVVMGMQNSKLFTKVIAFFAVPWAKNMAGESNKFGAFISFIGEPICSLMSKVKNTGAKYVRS